MSDLTAFLLARIDEDEERARPKTVGMSGGSPNPMLPNCFECYAGARWALDDLARQHAGDDGWYRASPEAQALVHEHEWTHADARQMRVLAECEAKRRIVDEYVWDGGPSASTTMTAGERRHRRRGLKIALRYLASVYADHPDFREEWRA